MEIKLIINTKSRKKSNDEILVITPRIDIKERDLLFTLGSWLRVISSDDRYVYSSEIENKVKYTLSRVFALAGISKNESCILDQYDPNTESFMCHFENDDADAKISLFFGDGLERGQEITIDYKDEEKTWDYYKDSNNKEVRLCPLSFVFNNKENGNRFCRNYYYSLYDASLRNNDEYLSLTIHPKERLNSNCYYLDGEEKIKEYLSNLSFPVSIVEVYDKISEFTAGFIKECSEFTLSKRKIIDGRNSKVTDTVALLDGQLKQFMLTKNDKTIIINPDGSWSFKTAKFSMSKAADDSYDYGVHINPNEKIGDFDWWESTANANKDIDEAKEITDRITKKH